MIPHGRDEDIQEAIDRVKADPGYTARVSSLRRLKELHTYIAEVLDDEPAGVVWTVAAELFAELRFERDTKCQ